MSVMEMKFMGTDDNITWSQDPTSLRRKVPLNVKKIFLQILSLLNKYLLKV